jgi:hypothetical protein
VRQKVNPTSASRKASKRTTRGQSNVLAFPPRIARERGRLDLQGVVRLVKPTGANLSTSQRAAAQRAGIKTVAELDRYALALARQEERRPARRRDGETDEAYARRRRYFECVDFMRSELLEFEALRPTAEGAPSDYVEDLDARLASVEAAMVCAQGGETPKRRNIRAVRAALEEHRTSSAAPARYVPDVDAVRNYACQLSPALASIPTGAWANAVERWPGIGRHARGGGARICWYHVVYDLLKSAPGLTDAKSPQGLRDTWEDGATSKAKK